MFSVCSAVQEILEKAAKSACVNPSAPIHVHWKKRCFALLTDYTGSLGFGL